MRLTRLVYERLLSISWLNQIENNILHNTATITYAIRTATQQSKTPFTELAARFGLNQKSVAVAHGGV